jgi:hypothetical protein
MSRPWRLPILILLPLLVVAGLVVQSDDEGSATDVRLSEMTSTAAAPGTLSSTWYCAAGSATGVATGEGAGVAEHQVILANASDVESAVRVTIITEAPETKAVSVSVAPHSRRTVTLSDTLKAPWASALVEASGGEITAAHQLSGPNGRSISNCASTPSSSWYFPGGTTVVGADLWIALFNPFPGEATVDVAFDTNEGARIPQSFQGIVVPSRRVVVKKVNDPGVVSTTEEVSTTVSVRSGRIVAEMIQSDNGREDVNLPKGLTATIGATVASPTWMFPTSAPPELDGTESVWVFNPGDTDATVRVQVQVKDPEINGTVEPFEITVAAHRAETVVVRVPKAELAGGSATEGTEGSEGEAEVPADGTAALVENRVPDNVRYWILVQSTDGADVVAMRMLTGTDRAGVTYSVGIPVVATRWLLPVAGAAETESSLVTVANPSATDSVTVTLRRQAGGSASEVHLEEVDSVLEPGEFVVFDLVRAGLVEDGASVEVVSDGPVVVGQWLGFRSPRDIASPLGIPVVGTQSLPLDLIGPGAGLDDAATLPEEVDPSLVPDTTISGDTVPGT